MVNQFFAICLPKGHVNKKDFNLFSAHAHFTTSKSLQNASNAGLKASKTSKSCFREMRWAFIYGYKSFLSIIVRNWGCQGDLSAHSYNPQVSTLCLKTSTKLK